MCLPPWPVLEGTSTCWQLPSTDPGRDRQLGEKSRQPRGSPRPYFYNGQYACQFPRPPCDLCTPTTAPGVPSLTAAAFASRPSQRSSLSFISSLLEFIVPSCFHPSPSLLHRHSPHGYRAVVPAPEPSMTHYPTVPLTPGFCPGVSGAVCRF